MFSSLFRRCSQEEGPLPSAQKLKQALVKLEEKENRLQRKISLEVERAKEFTRVKNRQAALQCLKRKKFYEVQMEHLGNFQSRIHDEEEKLPTHCGPMHLIKSDAKSSCTQKHSA